MQTHMVALCNRNAENDCGQALSVHSGLGSGHRLSPTKLMPSLMKKTGMLFPLRPANDWCESYYRRMHDRYAAASVQLKNLSTETRTP